MSMPIETAFPSSFPYKIMNFAHQSLEEHWVCNKWLNEHVGPRNERWAVVWIKGQIYAFKEEQDAMFFMLRFSK